MSKNCNYSKFIRTTSDIQLNWMYMRTGSHINELGEISDITK